MCSACSRISGSIDERLREIETLKAVAKALPPLRIRKALRKQIWKSVDILRAECYLLSRV